MTTLARLGLEPVINAVGPATRFGGLPLSEGVLAAMQSAIVSPVRMDELQEAAGRQLAELLGVPSCYVTSGASAALTLATAVCASQGDPLVADGLPHSVQHRTVLVQRAQRDPYDHAITAAGPRLVEVGYPDSTLAYELAGRIDADVVAVLWRPRLHGDVLDLPAVAEIAHAAGVPVIVDGSLHIPPVHRLRDMMAAGADLVALSGGKGFRGPQTSGLLCGRSDLIAAVALHHQDMDIRAATFVESQVTGRLLQHNRQGLARGMKVAREQVLGLLTAVTEHLDDPARWLQHYERELAECADALRDVAALDVRSSRDEALDVPTLLVDCSQGNVSADAAVVALQQRHPRVFVGDAEAWRGILTINPMALGAGDGRTVGERIVDVQTQAAAP